MDPGVLELRIPIVAIVPAVGVKIAKVLASARASALDLEVFDRIARRGGRNVSS